jgi:hypothetical protein
MTPAAAESGFCRCLDYIAVPNAWNKLAAH